MSGVDDNDIERLLSSENSVDAGFSAMHMAVSELMKSFDTVQIFCTRFKPGEGTTTHFDDGYGNWFARYGQIMEWIVRKEAEATRGGSGGGGAV